MVSGAAAYADFLYGSVKNKKYEGILLLDIFSSSLAIEMGGVKTYFIYKGTYLPAKKNSSFTTTVDNQTNFSFRLIEGRNILLGEFQFDGIPPMLKALPVIDISISFDSRNCFQRGEIIPFIEIEVQEKSSGKKETFIPFFKEDIFKSNPLRRKKSVKKEIC